MLKTTFLNNVLNQYKIKPYLVLLFLIKFSSTTFSETKLVILGSGTPNPDPNRFGSGYAIIVNEKAYIVDFGPGIVRRISAMSPSWGGKFSAMELENINIAFLTHIHSDHSGALADLILTPWVMGRDEPLKLFGPQGLKKMAKKIEGYLKLQVPAGQASPSPPIGPALGQRGLNIMDFCKAFNAKTQEMEAGAPCPTIITYYVDKSFSMEIKTPPASFFLTKHIGSSALA